VKQVNSAEYYHQRYNESKRQYDELTATLARQGRVMRVSASSVKEIPAPK